MGIFPVMWCRFESEPWYKPEPTGLGWLLQTVLVKMGLKDPSHVPGPRFKSDGFRIEELVRTYVPFYVQSIMY